MSRWRVVPYDRHPLQEEVVLDAPYPAALRRRCSSGWIAGLLAVPGGLTMTEALPRSWKAELRERLLRSFITLYGSN